MQTLGSDCEVFFLDHDADLDALRRRVFSRSTHESKTSVNTLDYAVERLGARVAIIECEYIDADYRSEFANFYATTFRQYKNTCERVHFFRRLELPEGPEAPLRIQDGEYLGFVVLRPVDFGRIGRTVLQPWLPEEYRYKVYPLCVAPFASHLFDKAWEVSGMPFIQQDSMVMSCAQASIWMATRYMSRRFNLQQHYPFDITRSAFRSAVNRGRLVPSDKLMQGDMVNALNTMGYSPLLYNRPKQEEYPDDDNGYRAARQQWNPVKLIYSFIESQMPVIIGVDRHALTVVGHLFSPERKTPLPTKAEMREKTRRGEYNLTVSTEWVNAFMVHDDSIGPYRILPVTAYRRYFPQPHGDGDAQWRDVMSSHHTDEIHTVIGLLPSKVYMTAEVAEAWAARSLCNTSFHAEAYQEQQDGNLTADSFLTALYGDDPANAIVLRTYFTSSARYKEMVANEACDIHPILKNEYLDMRMPHYIWVTEITTSDRLSREDEHDRRIVGEILMDTTQNKCCSMPLSVHLPGGFRKTDANAESFLECIRLNGDQDYLLPNRAAR